MCEITPSTLGRDAAGIELLHEHGDALGLVRLADRLRHLLEATETPQKATIGLVGPPDVAGAAPAIVVRDTGSGIPKEMLGRVFERFYRVDRDRSRERGGTGLGLAIVKHLCQNLGANVSVKSELDRGSEFRVQFPSS